MIKHYCDFCGKEITEYNRIELNSAEALSKFSFSNDEYECCDDCFAEARAYFKRQAGKADKEKLWK